MKSHVIFFAFIFYACIVQTEQNNPDQQPPAQRYRPSISITINSKPHSGCQLDSAMNQETQHASLPDTHVDSAIQQKTNQSNHNSRDIVADALNAYITFLCWPVGGLIYLLRSR